ncbi:unnamed protein product [Notodromas monacha]|uniref:SGNH hydrolase-type esterase domain-containing protein n=1 Tax=Notodromas monacha TaxID=399045 RepID=A0A7R9BTJ6_9CRUS|nr:unnamed protein product [Notodromas monacha]CAG0920421.1 unnamed protein product [Notodromas monacha]
MHVKSCRPSFLDCIVLMGWGFVIVALITSSFRKMKSVTPSEMDHHQQHPKLVTWPKVVLFGDSLTQYSMNPNHGWATILAHSLQRRCDVIVRGFSGYNTVYARHLLPRIANTFDDPVAAVVILLGTNDAADAVQNVRLHVPLEGYRKNLAWMVKFMQDKGVSREKIILMSPPAADVKKRQTEAYARVCEEVAHGANISSINLCKLMQDKFKNKNTSARKTKHAIGIYS